MPRPMWCLILAPLLAGCGDIHPPPEPEAAVDLPVDSGPSQVTVEHELYAGLRLTHDAIVYAAALEVNYLQALVDAQARADAEAAERAQERRERPSAPSGTVTEVAAPTARSGGLNWDALAACESGGNWSTNTGNGYFGGLQFDLQTWRANGGSGHPHHHSRGTQIAVAETLYSRRGDAPWPTCGHHLYD